MDREVETEMERERVREGEGGREKKIMVNRNNIKDLTLGWEIKESSERNKKEI